MPPAPASRLGVLTARESDYVVLAIKGLTNKQIARQLGVTPNTVRVHLYNVYRKLGISKRTALRRCVTQAIQVTVATGYEGDGGETHQSDLPRRR